MLSHEPRGIPPTVALHLGKLPRYNAYQKSTSLFQLRWKRYISLTTHHNCMYTSLNSGTSPKVETHIPATPESAVTKWRRICRNTHQGRLLSP